MSLVFNMDRQTKQMENRRLYEYLTPESKVAYIAWKRAVPRRVRHGEIPPVFWLDLHMDFLLEIQEELPENIRNLVFQIVNGN